MQPMNAMDEWTLRGFQQTRTVNRAIEESEKVEQTERRLHEVMDRLGEIDEEIMALQREQEDLEEEQIDLEQDAEYLAEDTPEPGQWFGCTECSWKTLAAMEPDEWHAEQHAHETGHTVALVQRDGSQFFAQDRIELEAVNR